MVLLCSVRVSLPLRFPVGCCAGSGKSNARFSPSTAVRVKHPGSTPRRLRKLRCMQCFRLRWLSVLLEGDGGAQLNFIAAQPQVFDIRIPIPPPIAQGPLHTPSLQVV